MLLYCTVWGWKGPAERGGNSACGCLKCWRKQEKRERNSREQYTKKISRSWHTEMFPGYQQWNSWTWHPCTPGSHSGWLAEFLNFSLRLTPVAVFFPSRQRFLNLFVLCANPMLVIVCYGRIESLHVTMDDSWLQWEQIVTWIWTCGSPSQLQRLWRGRLMTVSWNIYFSTWKTFNIKYYAKVLSHPSFLHM